MRSATNDLRRFWRLFSLCVLVLAGAITPAHAAVDYSIDQALWQMLYGVTNAQINDPAWLARDDDGDGVSNGAELAAGTNPFDSTSKPAVTSVSNGAGGLTLAFPTVAGKQYVVQSASSLVPAPVWTAVSSVGPISGVGGTQSVTVPGGGAGKAFYRLLVQDMDTDGDGVSDWAEIVAGFDPTTAHTHGATEDDHTALLNDLAQENVVTITPTKATATQPTDTNTAASDVASITVTRGGTLHLNAITVPLSLAGTAVAGVDYLALPASVTLPPKVGSVTLVLTPLANSKRLTSATVTLGAMPGGNYTVGGPNIASVTIFPAGNANGTGLTGMYYNGTSATVTPYNPTALFAGTPALTRVDPTVDFNWNSGSPGTGVNATYFGVRWQGQVQPQYTETYYFDTLTDDGVKLWVNGQLIIDGWSYQSADRVAGIALQAGALYDIRMEYYQGSGYDLAHLYWYSNSQTKQVIPANRLYPLAIVAPPAIVSVNTAVGFVGQPFTFNVLASISGGTTPTFALGAGSAPLPAGLTLNATTGVISGTPKTAGDYPVALTATNTVGTGAAVLDIQILNAGSGVTRELWNNLAGPNVSDLPLATTPASTDTSLVSLEDNTTRANNTGERLRGYFTAPVTGNYYFWLAASNAAELWVSDSAEPVSLIRRAWVAAPGTASRSWNDAGQTRQRSPWLALVAGQQYYYEVLHNTGGSGASSNLSVGWLQDSTGAATAPTTVGNGIVPGYLLTPFDYPVGLVSSGSLFATNLSPLPGAISSAAGSATMSLNAGQTQALLHFNYGGLSSPQTSYAVYGPDDHGADALLYDINAVDKFRPDLKTPDGGYIWIFATSSGVSASTMLSDLLEGKAYLKVETVKYPAGEISGNFTSVNGSQQPPVPVADPGFTDDHATLAGAARFLNQAAYGAAPSDLAAVQANGYAAWITTQMSLPATHVLADVLAHPSDDIIHVYKSDLMEDCWWRETITAPDQLRQRVAFALSEIMVTSSFNESESLSDFATSLASYYDTLLDGAFGNFRDLLKAVTLHPTMGWYLNMQGNPKGSLATGLHPSENYAREIMQLFSIGLNRMWPDGSLVLDSQGNLVPTYDQDTITGMARVFTGWTWAQAAPPAGKQLTNFSPATDWTDPMTLVPSYHELGTKDVLDNVVLPAAPGYSIATGGTSGTASDPTTALCNTYCNADLDQALDAIFYHPNVGPLVCRELIQRLVKSNPSPAYLYRVVQKFNDDGTSAHVRGNLGAVIRAILLDGEARNVNTSAAPSGKLREPLLRLAEPARTFLFTASAGTYSQSSPTLLNITLPAGTASNHLGSGDNVYLDFTVNDTGTPPVAPWNNPTTGNYTVASSPAPTTTSYSVTTSGINNVGFTVTAPTAVTPSTNLTVKTGGPSLNVVNGATVYPQVYLQFLPAGSGPDGVYSCGAKSSSNYLQVHTPTAPTGTGVVVPQIECAYFVDNPINGQPNVVTIFNFTNANFKPGDKLWLDAPNGTLPLGVYTVATIVDEQHFTVQNSVVYSRNANYRYAYFYPLQPLPQSRSGKVNGAASKFDMGGTDGNVTQTPLNSPTVFNFFYPNYEYPGEIAAANVTSPEFQLTTDTNVITLTNTLNQTFLYSGNPNGLCSFNNGSLVLDLSTYMAAPYSVADVNGVTALVNTFSDLLTGGQLTSGTKTEIVNYITGSTTVSGVTKPNFDPTASTNVRDRVRSIVQLIMISPEYAVQH